MFGFFKKKKEDKVIGDAMEIIGKCFILAGYPSDDAMQVAMVALDSVIKEKAEKLPKPWVLAVWSMHKLASRIESEESKDTGDLNLVNELKTQILNSMHNARKDATDVDLMVLKSIERYAKK